MNGALTRSEAQATGWENVRSILGVIFTLFGPPTELLTLRLLPRAWRAELVAWLRPAEALVRRLLLVRAAELAGEVPPPAATKKAAAAKPVRAKPERTTPADESTAWKHVSFTLMLPKRRRSRARPGTHHPVPFYAQGLAERLEALIRVVHQPERAALRLAKRLKRSTDEFPIARLLRPVLDHPKNPAREAMKRLAPYTDEADRFFSSG